MKLAIECFTKKYATFAGRAQRKEFWFFQLALLILGLGLVFFDVLAGTMNVKEGVGLFSGIFLLATIIPNLAVGVRRMHDTDRSGWWILISIIPIIGQIWFIVLLCFKGTDGKNRFGENPLAQQFN